MIKNRTLKFRAWDKLDKVMFVPTFIAVGLAYRHLGKRKEIPYFDLEITGDAFRTSNQLMQYTGLKDKNGKDSYREDIVEIIIKGIRYRRRVHFRDGAFCVHAINPKLGDHLHVNLFKFYGCFEIIGNIHENPELLKNQSQNPR